MNLRSELPLRNPLSDKQVWSKVPAVTIIFWIIKVMATTVGETAADFLNMDLNFGLTATTIVISILLLAALYLQFKSSKYTPWIYWLTVVLISIVGTLITDNLVDNLGVPLEVTTVIFTLAVLAAFAIWYSSEKTLSIHSIHTPKREAFYWLTILFTFALGTSAGDLMAEGINLGYWQSAAIFAVLIAAVAIAHYRFELHAVPAFWIVYILTRPLGASLGDFLSQPRDAGGLELSAAGINILFFMTILGLVIYLTKTNKDLISLSQE
jgi:uncharacterized membrane-anchored protein